MTKLRVWIDHDLCTGDGICTEICPALFGMHEDGLAYVKEEDWDTIYGDGSGEPVYQMADGTAAVPDKLVTEAVEAAEECPGECIFFDVVE